ncbi:tumor necrosis factor receptor superfamily member 11A-like isoform X1 [Anguilla anguilla]|uniref:tumor necrosis factor receptor superfamily member 11A-like isoform X1 n=1 Tax=Anguilla anguilla TaxID=7936 RepID=UPI0015AC5CAA|nr:tumor necrosis factor receptor superfamily member 11A-like isoform X1 [Anguilla anguilla]
MGVDITTSWIIHIWIRQLIVCVCAQVVFSKPSCGPHQYVRDKRCCKKCEPGKYMLDLCTSKDDTICRSCGPNEYQPDWNNETRCLTQKFCDRGRGFEPDRPENHTAAVPCRCRPGLQCSLVNCEYCEKMPVCRPGYGITVAETTGRGSCAECRPGLFSNVSSAIEPCRPWTDCKALGRVEKEPGTSETDAVCGPHVPGSTISWAIVAVLSVITAISLVILFLFCCKDKLKSLTENVRTCVQDLKRNSMLQETALTPYDGVHGTQNRTLEITCLIRQEGDPKASQCASAGGMPEHAAAVQTTGGAGEPSAGACRESWEPAPAPPPPSSGSGSGSGSCSCALSLKEPLEVGENEDCSQAVAPPCSCPDRAAERPLLEPPVCDGNCSGESPAACPRCARPHGSCDPCPGSGGRVERRGGASEGGVGERDCGAGAGRRSTDSATKAPLSLVSDCEPGLPLHLSTGDLTQGPELEGASHSVAAGHVTGNSNTTFISNGQVMNFSGDVIVVYVSQDSQADSGDLEEAFPNPVQEETTKEGFEVVTKPKTSQPPQENVSVF